MNILYVLLVQACLTTYSGTISFPTVTPSFSVTNTADNHERSTVASSECSSWNAHTFTAKAELDAYLDENGADRALVLDVAAGKFAEVEQQQRPRYSHHLRPVAK